MLGQLPDSIGEALRRQRAGLAHIVFYQLSNPFDLLPITVRSSAFGAASPIPDKYTADGGGLSPPLEWSNAPADAQSIVVMVEDADSPTPQPLVHAIIVNLEAEDTHVPEGALNVPATRESAYRPGATRTLCRHGFPRIPPGDMASIDMSSKCLLCVTVAISPPLRAGMR